MYINWHLHSKKVKAKNAKKAKGNEKNVSSSNKFPIELSMPNKKLNLGGVFQKLSNIYDQAFCKRSR